MKIKNLLFAILATFPAWNSYSQNTEFVSFPNNADTTRSALKTTWVTDRFEDHWFISVHGGIADMITENSSEMKFMDRVNPTFGLSFGKWISPVWGVRVNITGADLHGYVPWDYATNIGDGDWYNGKNYPNPYGVASTSTYLHGYDANVNVRYYIRDTFFGEKKTSSEGKEGYDYDVKYAAASIDFLLNLKNFFMPYNPDAVFNPILYGGIGLAHTFKVEKRTAVNSIMEKFGLMLDFRLNDAWSVNLDGQLLILPEIFDRRAGDGNTQDGVANYTVGFTYKFKERDFHRAILADQAQIAALNEQINELRKRPVACPPVVVCPECPKVREPRKVKEPVDVLKTPVTKQNLTFLPTPVFFRINSSVIDDAQWNSIQKAAEYLNENPTKRIKISGYADRKTGTAAINQRLSEQRAKAVFDSMVNKYNISPTRIETSYMGDTFQPFAENDWNRVVIFVIPDN